jgi:hypothetical protein
VDDSFEIVLPPAYDVFGRVVDCLPVERGPSVRWHLHLSARLRERIKALAAMRGLQDSQMVEELLWRALAVVGSPDEPTVKPE